ncbi:MULTISPECIES: dihydrodipicolinate synthase family protein [Marinovum]|jgi:4-hydroxy-tetrahydrodipicolinate synthase|uniref:4-hydroxy-tetrahydrodipicolinate synthase n=1 Tax=Marinovum algicola TaxID=42444 RepID=A0A975ZQL2_9RHOB|nr:MULTISPECIES: dihydrodipicolinate synthase family protein [Marinovum]AKO99403.1 Dihydrodipicolinate synthase/N-acetylneuraminate lyase [Marinovum algicola DG 898]MDD9746138.1 dihydrodipicolinate synthase family protein [Marinovum sp. PR37]SEK07328.1 4-hydroxy-tetrahydrodipicolinate synthase [Marinovum algicola]SLN75836.1 4-hydroxy-tetrahydrodipicolinate synthase [Marinovum algicola]
MQSMDLRGLNPAPVTAFNRDGSLDIEANVRIAKWLASFDEVKSLVILGHAGEGTFLTTEERLELIAAYRDAVDIPIIAGITGEGTKVAAEEAKRSYDAGATGALVYPNHGWLRFGFQKGAPQDRYKAIYQEGGLQTILFQYPAATKANYDLETQLDIAAQEGCVATKNGVRDMKRWYVEIPALKEAQPDLQILSCHDEWLLPTMFDVDGLLVGYGNIAPELLIDLIAAGKAQDYTAAREVFERLLPVTQAVYHRGSHMEGTVALKIGLRHRGLLDHATIREPLKDLGEAAEREIEAAFEAAGIGRVELAVAAE